MSSVTRQATVGTRESRPPAPVSSSVKNSVAKVLSPEARRVARVRSDIAAEAASAAEVALDAAEKARQLAAIAAKASWDAGVSFFGSLSVDFLVVVVTLGVLALITFIYLKLKPTILLPNTEFYGQCPDRWIFREDNYAGGNEVGGNSTPLPNRNPNPSLPGLPTLFSTQVIGKCWPTYQTTCQPFDPSLYTATRCEIAKSCGTTWTGLCP